MRRIFLLLAIISAGLFVASVVSLSRQYSQAALPALGEIKGFEENKDNNEYNQLVQKFRQRIAVYNEKAEKGQTMYFWMSFLVTALTAASTLISSIQAAKKNPVPAENPSQKFVIILAILTFCSTLANFASTHFNDRKTEATKKAVDITTMRNQFFADYDKASTENKPSVIRSYDQKLD